MISERVLWMKLKRIGINNKRQLKKVFGKDGYMIKMNKNMGARTFNEICIMLKKYKYIKYGASKNNTCLVCGEKLEPVIFDLFIKEDKYFAGNSRGYICGCTKEMRGD